MAAKGKPSENGYVERLIRTIKEEEVNLSDYQHLDEAREQLGYFIDVVYNQLRPHSALDYQTPAEFEAKWLQTQLPQNSRDFVSNKLGPLQGLAARNVNRGDPWVALPPPRCLAHRILHTIHIHLLFPVRYNGK